MTKLIPTLALIVLACSVKAQSKQYAHPDPVKAYTFTIKASQLDSLLYFVQSGSSALFQTDMPAKRAMELNNRATWFIRDLSLQLRQQVVADSLKGVKK